MNRFMSARAYETLGGLALMACLLCGAGCSSTGMNSSYFADVMISGNTPGQIRDVAIAVFRENGYQATRTDPKRLLFEKKGTGMDNFAYGSWLGDDPVWVRVKGAIMPAGEMTFRLECSAFMVRDRDGSTEEEIALTRIHRGPYQKMLDEVARRFSAGGSKN